MNPTSYPSVCFTWKEGGLSQRPCVIDLSSHSARLVVGEKTQEVRFVREAIEVNTAELISRSDSAKLFAVEFENPVDLSFSSFHCRKVHLLGKLCNPHGELLIAIFVACDSGASLVIESLSYLPQAIFLLKKDGTTFDCWLGEESVVLCLTEVFDMLTGDAVDACVVVRSERLILRMRDGRTFGLGDVNDFDLLIEVLQSWERHVRVLFFRNKFKNPEPWQEFDCKDAQILAVDSERQVVLISVVPGSEFELRDAEGFVYRAHMENGKEKIQLYRSSTY